MSFYLATVLSSVDCRIPLSVSLVNCHDSAMGLTWVMLDHSCIMYLTMYLAADDTLIFSWSMRLAWLVWSAVI